MRAQGSRVRRFIVWVVVLAAAGGFGFGIGALTYKPPSPGLDSASDSTDHATQTASASPTYRGPVVPDLVGLTRTAAERQLKQLRPLFIVQPLGGSSDLVVTQDPAAGTPLRGTLRIAIGVRCRSKPSLQPPEGRITYDPCSGAYR